MSKYESIRAELARRGVDTSHVTDAELEKAVNEVRRQKGNVTLEMSLNALKEALKISPPKG